MYTEYSDEYAFARPYIAPDESILWKGKPGSGNLVTARDIILIPFSIVWCGFAFIWELVAILSGAPFFFALSGTPFVCVGLYLVAGRFFWTAWIRKRTAYVITSRKIIRARGNRIDMMESRNMPPVRVTAFRDGCGTITIGYPHYHYSRNGYAESVGDTGTFILDNIPDVARVQQLIAGMER